MKRLTMMLMLILAAVSALAGNVVFRPIDVVEDSSNSTTWSIGMPKSITYTQYPSSNAHANTWAKSDSTKSFYELVNEAADNDSTRFYYVNTADTSYVSVKIDVGDTTLLGSTIDSVLVVMRRATNAASTKTLQMLYDTTGDASYIILDTTTAPANNVFADDSSRAITSITTRTSLTKLRVGFRGITGVGTGKWMMVSQVAARVFTTNTSATVADFDTSEVYDSRFWDNLTVQVKGRAESHTRDTGGGADSGAVTFVLQQSVDGRYWIAVDSVIAPDSLALLKNLTVHHYPFSRFIAHWGTKTDSSGTRATLKAFARGLK